MIKPIAFYLPQYYTFPENDRWWGEGFTEWTNVKKSKPLFSGHYQPTVPLNENYYSLNDIETMYWQVSLAKKYNIFGFCFYHYWFGEGRQLMEKPVDAFLAHKDLNLPFCLSWANHNWSRTWVGGDKDILMDMRYGNQEEWEKHFQYLLPFFNDERYIKVDNKPVFLVYLPANIPNLGAMCDYFRNRAVHSGFSGLLIVSQNSSFPNGEVYRIIDYFVEYEPNYATSMFWKRPVQTSVVSPRFSADMISHAIKATMRRKFKLSQKALPYDYDAIWDYIIKHKPPDSKRIAGAFVRCDVSPRRQERAIIYVGDSPEKFRTYMKKMATKIREEYSTDFMFLSAWNEWGEGMYLEPDEKNGFGYLEGVRDAVM